MNALVEQTAFGITTSSRTVAEVFEKEHRSVLASIDSLLEKKPELRVHNFMQSSVKAKMPTGGEREYRAFEMDRDGFTLLAMGFTGEKALDWKLAYIDAFNTMEASLSQRAAIADAGLDYHALPSDETQLKVAVIREARHIFPRVAVRRMWQNLGLPSPDAPTDDDTPRLFNLPRSPQIRNWMAERVDRTDPRARIMSSALYADYLEWCAKANELPVSQRVFGGELSGAGIDSMLSNGTWRLGVKLAD